MSTVTTPFAVTPQTIDAPAPDPTRFGLFSVSNVIEDPSLNPARGFQWEPLTCGAGQVATMVCEPDSLPALGGWSGDVATAPPFVVSASYDCSVLSRPIGEAVQIARDRLAMATERAVEYVLASGDVEGVPGFADAVEVSAGADLESQINALEQFLAENYLGSGVIHVPRGMSAGLSDVGVERHGARLETLIGTGVAAGAGYDLAGLTGPVATGRPTVWLGDVFVTPDVDQLPNRTNNDVTITAARVVAAGWDCEAASIGGIG